MSDLSYEIFHPQFSELKNTSFFSPKVVKEKWDSFCSTIENPNYGFFFLKDSEKHLSSSKEVFKKFSYKTTFVHVGIGGSSLGPEMLCDALKEKSCTREFIFINNIDPDMISDQLYAIELSSSLFYIVSKSGGTAETMAAFAIICEKLKSAGISEDSFKDYFVFATDPNEGHLKTLGEDLDIERLEVPSNIGGRFSVFTPVGFLPALFAEISVDEILKGVREFGASLLKTPIHENILCECSSFLAALKSESQIRQTVFMPYSSKLRSLSFWFTQLWAESLGKKFSKNQEVVYDGLTPIPAYGATDQHSQVQLFMEGPYDKCLLLIEIENFHQDFSLKNSFDKIPSLSNLSDYNLSDLMKAEFQGTQMALKENERPFISFKISSRTPYELGKLVLFFESLTVLMGEWFDINPFDQPGVEAGKKYAFSFMENLPKRIS